MSSQRRKGNAAMKLLVGLGNPGAKFAGNRHNVGFMAVDRIATDHGFGPWRRGYRGLVAEGRLGEAKVVLLKPETFMNLSGQSVGEAMRFFRLTPADVVVFHDELDLAPGKIRVKDGGGHAGHNGLRSMHDHIGEGYGRVRIGIGHPGHKDRVADYVLANFAKADAGWLDDLMRGISDGASALAAGDGARFLNAVALRVTPPRASTGMQRDTGGKADLPPAGAAAGRVAATPGDRPLPPQPATPDGSAAAQPRRTAQSTPVPAGPEPNSQGLSADTTEPAPRTLLQRLQDRFR